MEFFNSLNLKQIKGGTKLKQGDLGSVLSYSLTDENGQEITSFDNKTAYINLVLDDKIWFTTTTLVDISRVTFRIDKAIPIGLYYLEIKIDDYIFPSDRDSIILIEEGSTPYDLKELVPNYDINMTLKGILSDLSQKGIDINDLKTKMSAIYNNALADHAEITAARGTHPNLKSRLDNVDNKQQKTTEQLAQKVNKDDVTSVMTPKGTLAYASLPKSGNQVGWYYYCPDGDGTHGAGNYVWNGTSWFFGGTGDEGYNLLKKDLVNAATGEISGLNAIDVSSLATLSGYYQMNNGNFAESSDFFATDKIRIIGGQKFKVTLRRIWMNSGICEYDSDGNFLRAPLGSDYVSSSDVKTDYVYTSSDDASYVAFSTHNATQIKLLKYPFTSIDNIKSLKSIVDANDVTPLLSALYDKYDVYHADFSNDGYMQQNGVVNGTGENYRHCAIPVITGDKFKISGRNYYSCTLYTFIGKSGNKSYYPLNGGVNNLNLIPFEASEDGTLYVNYTGNNDYKTEILKCTGYKSTKSQLDNKVILFTGDSICQALVQRDNGSYETITDDFGNTVNKKYGWAEIIKENNQDTVIRNYGVGGTTVAVRDGRDTSIYERLTTMYNRFPDADYIIIEGGVNDYYNRSTEQIGSMTDHFNGGYDTSTFAGGLEQIFYDANNNWKGKKIGFIATFKTADVSGWDTYMELAKQICEKWSVPYVDLFSKGRLNFRIEQMKNDYSYSQGGLHPNVDGYKIITPMIENWLKSI